MRKSVSARAMAIARSKGVWAIWFLVIVVASARGAIGQESIAALRNALSADDERARVAAIDKLAGFGPAAKDAVDDLAVLLTDKSERVRAHAAYALGMIGLAAKSAGPALAKAVVDDPDVHVRREAVEAIETVQVDIQIAGPALAKALQDDEPGVRIAALDVLTDIGAPAVPILSKALENEATRYWAALALGELGPVSKPAADALAKALDDNRPQVQNEVLIALAHVGPEAASAAPALAKLLTSDDASVHDAAAYALGRMGPAAADSTDALRTAMKNGKGMLPTICAYALARIEPNNKQALQKADKLLTSAIRHEDPSVQSAALRALRELNRTPAELAPQLADCIVDCDPSLLREMMDILAASGDAGVPALIEALKRPESRGPAALVLAQIGPEAKAAVGPLTNTLAAKDLGTEVRREVILALAAMGPDASSATSALTKELENPEPRVRAPAAYALGRIGPAARAALPKLRGGLDSQDDVDRVASAYAIVHVAPGDADAVQVAVPVLIHGLTNPLAPARRGAADALGHVGKSARRLAEGPLRDAVNDPDASVRAAARDALTKIGAAEPAK